MKPPNYHAINMQTSARLSLNQISCWGASGGGESSRRGAHRGWASREGAAGWGDGFRLGPRHLRAAQRSLEPRGLAWGPAPTEGAGVCDSRVQPAGGFPGLSAEVWPPPLIHLTRKSQLDQVPPPFFKTNSLNLSTLIRPVKH